MNNEMPEEEFKYILSYYNEIQKKLRGRASREQKTLVRKAFNVALNAHKNMRRRSGEPFILHPLEVSLIVLNQMNLGATSVICALLHDTVEDSDYTLEDIDTMFGQEVVTIIDGLTKIDEVSDTHVSLQFENFRKILLSMSKDPRVILIKLADRLHNMRTLASMPLEKQQKTASETLYMYAPLAHRLGFYAIKSELEDLSMKFQDPGSYNFIAGKIKASEEERESFIAQFIQPIEQALANKGMSFEIVGRTKSIYSIWQKMTKKQIPFEEVYDVFAIRIVIDVETAHQKSSCWSVYSVVTDIYKPNTDRLRDWISTPKANGYQALHTTVMSKTGKWVEVQIRSRQMDAIAENGLAAHWAYKQGNETSDPVSTNNGQEEAKSDYQTYEMSIETWLSGIREVLQKNEANPGEMINRVKMSLYSKEIYVFTPKGDEYTMPEYATVIDFAYLINEKLGNYCIGAKVNNKLAPPSQILRTGDQIEIITSQKQKVHEEWLRFAVTPKAKDNITIALERERQNKINQGKALLKEYFKNQHVEPLKSNRDILMLFTQIDTRENLYLAVYNGKITEMVIKRCFSPVGMAYRFLAPLRPMVKWMKGVIKLFSVNGAIHRKLSHNPQTILLGKSVHEIKQTIATCCNPVAGDPVIAFNVSDNEIIVHRVNCMEAIQFSARYGDRIVKAKWRIEEENAEFLAGIAIKGFDHKGLVNNITGIIYKDFKINCRSVQFETREGLFEGTIMLYIQNVEHLNKLIEQLRFVQGIEKVERINSYYEEQQKKKR
ncbi:MAG: RelA/SpoT family protein [Bacteroidales bacterium]|jgi:GTP pyrophosphokinase|nr:RelA/SpoT family protein [Bacteroidales bacterium]